VKGDVIVLPFPFSDLTQAKRRPALVVATLAGDDVILCQITSQAVQDDYAIPLAATDFQTGRLKHSSNIRPNRLFTADQRIILYRVGGLLLRKLTEVKQAIIRIIEQP
jgi:mRNA interferase MazF